MRAAFCSRKIPHVLREEPVVSDLKRIVTCKIVTFGLEEQDLGLHAC